MHGYLLHIEKGNLVTENRLLEAELALLNSAQCQGIGKEKKKKSLPRSAPRFYSCRVKVSASSCRLARSKSAARPSSHGGLCGQGGPSGNARLGKVRHVPFPPAPEDDSVGY